MAIVLLEAENREKCGTRMSRSFRREGFTPCVVYGDKRKPEPICISNDLMNKYAYKSNFFSTIFELKLDGENKQKLVAKDAQFHPLTDRLLHVDFMRVGKGSKVCVRVPLAFVNELSSPGLKLGGVLNALAHEVDIICDPEVIPEKIEIDLTGFEFHHTVHVHDLKLPEGSSLPVGVKNFTIATIVAPTIMKKEAAESTTEEAASSTSASASPSS
jgi:large subunit ribosomal protein L25